MADRAPCESGPDATVQFLVFYANNPESPQSAAGTTTSVATYVAGGDTKAPAAALVAQMLEHQFGPGWLSAQVKEKKIVGDTATVTALLTLRNSKTGASLRQLETLTLHRKLVQLTAEERKAADYDACWVWQVQPDETLLARWDDEDIGVLARMAVYIAFPERMATKNDAWISQSNIALLTLGAMKMAQDYGKVYALANDNFKEKLLPYVQDPSVFTAPGGAKNSVGYTLNAALENVKFASLAAAPKMAQIVAIYESKDGALDFRYDGKAAVGFADGSTQLVSRDEAKTLRWKP